MRNPHTSVDGFDALWRGAFIGGFACFFALVLACLEIEIEGKDGWAKNLPTWRRKAVVCGNRPWTGYHTALALTLISSTVSGAVVNATIYEQSTAGSSALLLLSAFVLVMALEDSYWYNLNYIFHEAVRRGDASDHFNLTSRIALYAFCISISFGLWVLGMLAWSATNIPFGCAIYGFALFALVLLEPLVRLIVSPTYRFIRMQLDGDHPDSSTILSPLKLLVGVIATIELVVLAAGVWAVNESLRALW